MIFLAPIAGLVAAAIGTGLVALLYMLKLRRRPTQVSSTLLWRRAVKDMEGNIPWQRISPTLLLLLHLLIVLLLALAIARPVGDDAVGHNQRVYLVIDTTASMSAVVAGESGLDRAKDAAIERVRALFDSGRSARVSVVAAGSEARVVLSDSVERGRIIGAIRGIAPSDQPGDLADAIALIEATHESRVADGAGGAEGGDGAEVGEGETGVAEAVVWAYTDGGSVGDGPLAMRGGGGATVPVFEPGDDLGNLGVTAVGAQRDRVDTALCRVFVRVGRGGGGPRAAALRVYEGEGLIASSAVSFEDDATWATHTFELRLMRAALLRIELGVDDALKSDDRAWVSIPDPSPVSVTVVAPGAVGDPLLVDVLGVITRAPTRVVAPGEPIGDADLVVYDRVSPSVLADAPSIGFASVLPAGAGAGAGAGTGGGGRRVLDEPGPRTRMISWDRSEPMLAEAGMGGVSYRRGVVFDETAAGTRVLGSDGQGAVIIERTQGSHRHVCIAFALHDSNWPVQVGFTIFMVNAIEYLLPGTGGRGVTYSTSEVISYTGRDGKPASAGPFARIGVQTLAGGETVGVSLLNADETALRTSPAVAIGSGSLDRSGSLSGQTRRELWRWFTLGAIVLIALEWFVYAGRVRIA